VSDAQIDALARLSKASKRIRLGPDAARLSAVERVDVATTCAELSLDYAFVPSQARLADFGLIAMDMDSTLITIECIDELAGMAGIRAAVAEITRSAMRGDINFAESLTRRVALLAGLDASALQHVYEHRLRLTPGAERMIGKAKTLGIKTVLISAGFTYFTGRLRETLGLNFVFANEPEIEHGKLTGRLLGNVLDAPGKAQKLLAVCNELGLAPERVIAVGDGANDLEMMAVAGVSIAYHAKEIVRKRATFSFDHVGLDGLLNLYL